MRRTEGTALLCTLLMATMALGACRLIRDRNKDTGDTADPETELEDAVRAISEAVEINLFATELGTRWPPKGTRTPPPSCRR